MRFLNSLIQTPNAIAEQQLDVGNSTSVPETVALVLASHSFSTILRTIKSTLRVYYMEVAIHLCWGSIAVVAGLGSQASYGFPDVRRFTNYEHKNRSEPHQRCRLSLANN